MAQAKGSNSKILIGSESVYKTAATDMTVLPFVSETFKLSRNLIDSKTIRSTRDANQPARGNMAVAGDVNVELAPCYAKMFYHTLGTVTTSGGSAPYTHVFKVSTLPVGITLEKQFTDLTTPEYFVYNGCKVNKFSLTVKPEGFVEGVFSLVGAGHTVSTSSLDSSPTDNGFTPFDGFGASIKEGNASLGVVTQLTLSIENNLDESVFVIDGTGTRYSLPEGIVKTSGTLTCLFDSMTQYNKAINNTETSVELTLTRGDGLGASAGNEKLTILLPELLLAPDSPVISGPMGVMVELPFTAYYNDDVNASSIMFTLLSPIASVT